MSHHDYDPYYDAIMSAKPRDQFSFMLLERIEYLECVGIEMKKHLEQHEFNEIENKRIQFIKRLTMMYRVHLSNTPTNENYYMKVFLNTLIEWCRKSIHNWSDPAHINDCQLLTQQYGHIAMRITRNVNEFVYKVIAVVWQMSVSDIDMFEVSEEIPDLLDENA